MSNSPDQNISTMPRGRRTQKSATAGAASTGKQQELLQRLSQTLDTEKANAAFTCGGKLVSKFPIDDGKYSKATPPDDPILFHEDKNGQAHKIVFPASEEEMLKLVSDCDQASFGVGTEERMDTEYRSAWKLDKTKFASSFHPFDYDIMEVIKQLLFSTAINPGAKQPLIVAELYKLNVRDQNDI
jgi:hypothetical protein